MLGILGETPPTLRRCSVTLRRLRHGAAGAGRRQGGNAEGAEACPPNTTLEGAGGSVSLHLAGLAGRMAPRGKQVHNSA